MTEHSSDSATSAVPRETGAIKAQGPEIPGALSPSSFLRQSWLVILLAMLLGGALAGVERGLQPRIVQQGELRLLKAAREVVPQGTASRPRDIAGERIYLVEDSAGIPRGWAIPASTTGFVDKIELLIGVSVDGEQILGLAVLQSKETPGLGDRIRDAEFRNQFRGQPTTVELDVLKPGQTAPHGIDAISGATISTWAVVRGVRHRLERIQPELAAAALSVSVEAP